MFRNRAAIAGFDESGSDPRGWYWLFSQHDINLAWAQRFSDGGQGIVNKYYGCSLRCVRG